MRSYVSLNAAGTCRVTGTINSGPVNVSILAIDLVCQDIIYYVNVHIRILPGQGNTVRISFAHDYDDNAFFVGNAPPLSRIKTNRYALCIARELVNNRGLAVYRIRDVHQIFMSIHHTVFVIIRCCEDTGLKRTGSDLGALTC